MSGKFKSKNMEEGSSKSSQNKSPKKRKKIFKDFGEYWHFAKFLSENQRDIIAKSLSKTEQKSLKTSYKNGGWEDLLMRNTCDYILELIKKQYNIDLLELRQKVISGQSQLVQKKFWNYINLYFDKCSWDHISYIFGGLNIENHDKDYIKLSPIKRKH